MLVSNRKSIFLEKMFQIYSIFCASFINTELKTEADGNSLTIHAKISKVKLKGLIFEITLDKSYALRYMCMKIKVHHELL